MKRKIILCIAIGFLTACSSQALIKKTSSGKPESVYHDVTVNKVQNAYVAMCNEKGFVIAETTASSVTCQHQASSMGGILTGLTYGTGSSQPVNNVKFTISQINSDVKVWADIWMESQGLGGQVNKTSLNGGKAQNDIQSLMDKVGI